MVIVTVRPSRINAGPAPEMSDHEWLLQEASKIAAGLAETLAPLCEVVVHDLTNPEHAIIQIENNLSGRSVGDGATELGLARMADPSFPDIIANYANAFADGRPAKSTSIGLRDKSGRFVAAICINMDLSYLKAIGGYLNALTQLKPNGNTVRESLSGARQDSLNDKILAFSARKNRDPRSLTSDERRELLQMLADEGELDRRGAADQIGTMIGVSRSNVYYYLKGEKAKRA
jgi:predicted transcriptional regulator YheO